MNGVRVGDSDLEWWRAKAAEVDWIWAKSFADFAPHHYIVLGRTQGMDESDYERAGRIIRKYGRPGRFYSRTNIYFYQDGWKYWIMPDEGRDIGYNSTLINRAREDQEYGEQDAPSTLSNHPSLYDDAAVDYDLMWTKPEDLAENREVVRLIVKHLGAVAPSTLDIGCGTGLLLDLKITSPALYTGVDPSRGMLNEFVAKHPRPHALFPLTFEEYLEQEDPQPRSFDLVAGLFASPSYVSPEALERSAGLARDLVVLMHYDGSWYPDYYDGSDPSRVPPHDQWREAREATHRLVDRYPGYCTRIGNFDVTVLTP